MRYLNTSRQHRKTGRQVALTQVTKLLPGQRIQYGLSPLTVASVVEYGPEETELSFEEGGSIILANSNWFELI